MRIVAGRAFSAIQRRMKVLFGNPDLFLRVAIEAQVVAVLFQDEFGHDAMPQMAILALFLLDDRMNILHAEVFFSELRVAVETILAREFFPRRRTGARRQQDTAQKDDCSENAYGLFCKHDNHLLIW